ncbi:cation:proton antiporter [Robbsia andropogonis]|uniref:cation:proton antiporter n=1 Tax=Robbsia andropogonis TaxID=28092 RepID=UPI003D21E2D9
MPSVLPFFYDIALFIGIPWLIWVALRRSLPLAVVPILLGLILATARLPMKSLGLPSVPGDQIGFIGVVLLAFTAGLETRHPPVITGRDGGSKTIARPPLKPLRIASAAALALALPFVTGTLVSRFHLLDQANWVPPHGNNWISACAIGLCIAVSALPVLVGLLRELTPEQQPLGFIALSVALIDDAVLWLGLAAIQLAANVGTSLHWGKTQIMAIGCLVLLGTMGWLAERHEKPVHPIIAWMIAAVFLVGGSWCSARLGIHELIGAFAAGALLPPRWMRRIHIERLGQISLIALAPLFFGHSGLNIDGRVMGWAAMSAALLLLLVSAVSKMTALWILPPVAGLDARERWGIGTLLQCKGLMEIVAATVLHKQGLLSEFAYAALVTLAVISTTMTSPLFKLLMRKRHMRTAVTG